MRKKSQITTKQWMRMISNALCILLCAYITILDFAYTIPNLAAARSRILHYPDWRPIKLPFHDWRYANKKS